MSLRDSEVMDRGVPYSQIQKHIKQVLDGDFFDTVWSIFCDLMKIDAFHSVQMRAKRVQTGKKCVDYSLIWSWSCLRQKVAPERSVHMCGHGPSRPEINIFHAWRRGGGRWIAKNVKLP